MTKRDWLQKEGNKWVEKDIITKEQHERILAQYPKKDQRFLLLAFAGLFIGLGLLSFIASNWSEINTGVKMAIILLGMIGFYTAGDRVYKKSPHLGASLLGIGVIAFGAGIILTGQMFHYMAYDASAFLIWSLAAVAVYLIRREAMLLILGFLIMTGGQLYGWSTYQDFHIGLFILLIVGFGYFTYIKDTKWVTYLFSLSYILQSLVLVFANEIDYFWLIFMFAVLYALGEFLEKSVLTKPMQYISILAAFIIGIWHVFFLDNRWLREDIDLSWGFFICTTILLLMIATFKFIKKRYNSMVDLALFFPVFVLPFINGMSVLVLLFIFSLGRLLAGYKNWDVREVNTGTVFFLISTTVAYFQLAWDFLDKSLFFFTGGILLFILSYFLERRRRKVARHGGEGEQS